MTVESLRRYFSNLSEFVRDIGGQSPVAAELQELGDTLKPFDGLTVEGLSQLLTSADEYRRAGAIDPPTTTLAELNAHIQQTDAKLKAAKSRVADMRKLDKQRSDTRKKADKAAADAVKPKRATKANSSEPDEVSRRMAESIGALTEKAKTTEVSDATIDAEIAKLDGLEKGQLYHIAKLINATAGLTARSGAKAIIARITERLQGVKDSFDRADL